MESATYKILSQDKEKSEITIEVVFEDSTVYHKRMMVTDIFDDKANTADIEKWLNDYLPSREAVKTLPKAVTDQVGVVVPFTVGTVVAPVEGEDPPSKVEKL